MSDFAISLIRSMCASNIDMAKRMFAIDRRLSKYHLREAAGQIGQIESYIGDQPEPEMTGIRLHTTEEHIEQANRTLRSGEIGLTKFHLRTAMAEIRQMESGNQPKQIGGKIIDL